jgi:hypothetical protein
MKHIRKVSGLARQSHPIRVPGGLLERFPIAWTHAIDQKSLQIQELEHIPVDRIDSIRSEYALMLTVAVHALALFVAFLSFHRQGRDRSGVETFQRDRLAGFFAIAIGAVVKAPEGRIDF